MLKEVLGPRRSGRTTRMLQEVLNSAIRGQRQMVIASDLSHRHQLERSLKDLYGSDWVKLPIQVRTIHDPAFIREMDGEGLPVRRLGYPSSYEEFSYDHYTQEQVLKRLERKYSDE